MDTKRETDKSAAEQGRGNEANGKHNQIELPAGKNEDMINIQNT